MNLGRFIFGNDIYLCFLSFDFQKINGKALQLHVITRDILLAVFINEVT